MLSDIYFELVEDVTPDLLHVVPILHHAVLHRVLQLQDALEFFSLLADESILLNCCKHDSLVFRSADIVVEYD